MDFNGGYFNYRELKPYDFNNKLNSEQFTRGGIYEKLG